MSLSHLFPNFSQDRILYEDEDLVVIDKPAGVSTHAAEPGRVDDAVSRLRMAIAERDRLSADDVYLGIHQRLDRDTSGVLLFTRRKAANAAVARQFEERRVKKTYRAAVLHWPKHAQKGVLSHVLVKGEGGTMQVAKSARVAGGQKAVTHYRVLDRREDRSIVELSPETGRTHQLRVQVAAFGGAIAGDRLYGEAPFYRLLLHACSLELRHPTTGRSLVVRAPPSPELGRWLADPAKGAFPPDELFAVRLSEAIEARWSLGTSADTDAFRLVHGEGDGLEGIAVDCYGDFLLAHFFSEQALAHKESILDQLAALGPRGVYSMMHPKQANTIVDPKSERFAPSRPVRGDAADTPLVVRESGLSFEVRLGEGLKTGIFLDQRENRKRVRELAKGKSVLNLFAYTCAFTVAAAAGGATRTVSVDASPGVLAWGVENLRRNGFGGDRHVMLDVDALSWLRAARKRNETFDLVILDPPSYATTKTSRFSAASDFPELAADALRVLTPGGRLLVCTNHRGISLRKFRRQMHEAGRLAARTLAQVKDLPDPADFPFLPGSDPHLKSLLVTLA